MAEVHEVRYSREGALESVSEPSHGFSRTFEVVMDAEDDYPVSVLLNTRVANTNERITQGAAHPWHSDMVLTSISPVEKMTDTRWVVVALYESKKLVITTWRGWIPSMRSGDIYVRLFESLPTYTTDSMPSDLADDWVIGPGGALPANSPVKMFGQPKYRAAQAGEPYFHECNDDQGRLVELIRTSTRNQVGFDYPLPVANLTLSKDVAALNMPSRWDKIIGVFKNRTNSRTWFYYPPGRVLFQDAALYPVSNALGTMWHIELYFLLSYGPTQHLGFDSLLHTKRYNDTQAFVHHKATNKIVKEYFKVRWQADLNTLLLAFP
jgi:hypothetical protein